MKYEKTLRIKNEEIEKLTRELKKWKKYYVNHNIALSKELTSVEKKFEDLNITSAKRISDLVSIIDAKWKIIKIDTKPRTCGAFSRFNY